VLPGVRGVHAAGRVLETDEQLVRKAAWGDAAAFRTLTERHAAYLLRVATSLVGAAADAEDVVQHTLVGAFKGLASFRGGSSVKTWLTGITVRQAARWRRDRWKDRAVPLDPVGGGSRVPQTPDNATTAAVDARLDAHAVLDKLPADYRQVIVLRELEGMTYDQIAQTLGVPRGTVESRLHRARAELRQILKRE
jgi:RNA polymerase sigma-70 factor (ECF subfamily)